MSKQAFRPMIFCRMRFKPEKGILVVQSWNRVQLYKACPPRAWVKTAEGPGWRHNRGNEKSLRLGSAIRKVRRYHSAQRRAIAHRTPHKRPFNLETECLARFVELIEPPHRQQLYTLRSRAWQMYSMLYRCPGALELSRDNQGLAFALANHWFFFKRPSKQAMRTIRRLLRKPRRDIAAYLGFPPQEVSVRVLGRIHGRDLNLTRLLWLRQAMRFPKMLRVLSHRPWLKVGVLEALAHDEAPGVCSSNLLSQLAALPDSRAMRMGQRVVEALNYARLVDERVPRLVGVDQANRVYDNLLKSLRKKRAPRDAPLGPPPILGVPGQIEPLESTRAVYDEGVVQHNCLTDLQYLLDCTRANKYIYRVVAPERCTIALRRAPNANAVGWVVDDFKAAANVAPGDDARELVTDWLANAGIALESPAFAIPEIGELFEMPFEDDLIPFEDDMIPF